MASNLSRMIISLDAGPESEPEDVAALGQRLRNDLLDLDVDAVELVRSDVAPAGAKGDPITLGVLAVALAPTAVTAVFNLLQTWLNRRDTSTITVELGDRKVTLTGKPSTEQREYVDAMIKRFGA